MVTIATLSVTSFFSHNTGRDCVVQFPVAGAVACANNKPGLDICVGCLRSDRRLVQTFASVASTAAKSNGLDYGPTLGRARRDEHTSNVLLEKK